MFRSSNIVSKKRAHSGIRITNSCRIKDSQGEVAAKRLLVSFASRCKVTGIKQYPAKRPTTKKARSSPSRTRIFLHRKPERHVHPRDGLGE